jgi:hypothetical protein
METYLSSLLVLKSLRQFRKRIAADDVYCYISVAGANTSLERRYSSRTFRYGYLVTT